MSSLSNHSVIETAGGYQIPRSLRLRASATAYLSRTFVTPTNQNIWTFSTWLKRGQLGITGNILNAGVALFFNTSDQLSICNSAGTAVASSTAVFRDPSAWYHIVWTYNGTVYTVYVNGVSVLTYTGSLGSINTAIAHRLGEAVGGGLFYFDGYLAETYFVDGQALAPTSFGQTNYATGQWAAKKYAGTYGINGFYLPYSNTSTTTTLCADASGNSNNWTPTGISLTAGITYDSMLDVPSLAGGASGTRPAGNYAVLNPISPVGGAGATLSGANLTLAAGSGTGFAATMGIPTSGKYAFKIKLTGTANGSSTDCVAGFACNSNGNAINTTNYAPVSAWYTGVSVEYFSNGAIKHRYAGGTVITDLTAGATATNDEIEFLIDRTAGTCIIKKNGTTLTTVTGIPNANILFPFAVVYASSCVATFDYTPSDSNYRTLCTANLPTPSIARGDANMQAVLAAGASIKSSSEALFSGQFLEWIKDRANVNNHQLLDSVRGLTAVLQSNTTAAETTYTAPTGNSVGWVWKAGASAASNTSGTITSSVSANVAAGFSIVSYTGAGGISTVGHGLGIAPSMIIVKERSAVNDWPVYHASLGNTGGVYLDLLNAFGASTAFWDNTSPTSAVFTLGNSSDKNATGQTYVAYCFAEIAGYSKFGSYTGNGSADGPFIYCGFRPKYILFKCSTSASATTWVIKDTSRNPNNVADGNLYADQSLLEDITSTVYIDILSNGFKLRGAYAGINTSGGTYIFAAFAESPFNYSNAR
jgi:hypothetical protein